MNDFNKKLNKWSKINATRKYYIYFACMDGQLRLIVRDLSADSTQNSLDRFTLTYTEGLMENVGVSSDMFTITTGVNTDYLPVVDIKGREVPYTITTDERGILGSDQGFISSSVTQSIDFKASEIADLKSKGELE